MKGWDSFVQMYLKDFHVSYRNPGVQEEVKVDEVDDEAAQKKAAEGKF